MSLQQEVGWTRDMLRMARYLAEAQDAPFIVCSLDCIGDELDSWNNLFPAIEPTFHVGSNTMVEVQQYLKQFGLEFHVRNKKDVLALSQLELDSSNTVFSSSTKLSSHIKAAEAAGVQIFFVDSVPEMEKIKKVNPLARIIIELSAQDENNNESLEASTGVVITQLHDMVNEAKRLGLEIEGFAVNLDVTGSLDHDDNLVCVKKALKVAEAALTVAKEGHLEVKSLHLGQLCRTNVNIPDCYVNDINNILCNDIFRNIRVKADASHFLVSSCITLATKISHLRMKAEGVSYTINEGIFGAFASNLSSSECCVSTPLVLGGGGNRKGHSGKLLDAEVVGDSGDDIDVVLPMGDIALPRMEEGDWILFPNMGNMNLVNYLGSCRKVVGQKSFICLKKMCEASNNAAMRKLGDWNEFLSKEPTICVELDFQKENSFGLKGEIDLRKTFIYGN